MPHNYSYTRWRVAKDQYHRSFRRWSVTLWDYTTIVPGTYYMQTRHFFKFDKALKFALSSEAEDIRLLHAQGRY